MVPERIAHRDAAVSAAAAMAAGRGVLAVLLHGSVVRGTQRPDSDIDLFAVTSDGTAPVPSRSRVAGIQVEVISHSVSDWRERLQRPQPTWAYAWAEAEALADATGIGTRLADEARARLAGYRTPAAVSGELAEYWAHVRPKMAGTGGADLTSGFYASIVLARVAESLFAVNDRPVPPLSSSRYLGLLTGLPVPPGGQDLIAQMCTGRPAERMQAAADLVDRLRPLLADRARA